MRHRLAALQIQALLLSLALPALASANAGGGALACREEPELALAAAELLLNRDWNSSEAVSRSVRGAGSDAVMVRGYYSAAQGSGAEAFLAEFERLADAPTVCGVAHGPDERLLLVSARAGSLSPLSQHGTVVRGRLASGFTHPELVVADAGGALRRVPVSAEGLAEGVSIPVGLARPLRVQLLARGPHGLRPIAERMLAVGGAAPSGEQRAPGALKSGAEAWPSGATGANPPEQAALVQALAGRLARLRGSEGRRPVRPNALLDRVAVGQARDVCASGRIGHEPAPGQDPQARLRRAGVEARRVGETVARAEDAAAAFSAFERSPAHRLSLLEPGFTDAGYGQASDARGRACVVVLLAAWPRYVGR